MDRKNGGLPPYDDKNEGTGKWKTILTCLVEPDVKEEPKWMEWSPMDLLWSIFYSSFVFLYKPKSEVCDGDSVLPTDRLIESLGKALVHFYPLAGRLMKSKKDDRVRLYCNNEGAVFMHKRYDGILSELIDEDQFQPNELISGISDIQPRAETYDPAGLPALIIQVTEFRCGTTALSASWSHGVADGYSGALFLSSWARISRGEPLSVIPVHDRSLLSPRKSSRVLEGGRVRFLNNEPLKGPMETTMPNEGVRFKTVTFSRRKMDELKAETRGDTSQSGDGHGRALTTADCVTAYLWRLLTKLRNLEPHKQTRFVSLVNGRSRIKGFPAAYFGNCLVVVSSAMTAGELLSKPLNHAASFIHDAIQAVDEDVIRDWADWFYVHMKDFHIGCLGDEVFMPGDPRFNLHGINANWQNRFPFYDLDFGSGIPSNAIRNVARTSAYDCGMVVALPTSTTATLGDLKFAVHGENNVLDRLGDQL